MKKASDIKNLANDFMRLVGPENVLIDEDKKSYAALDESSDVSPNMPALVIVPQSVDELIKTVRFCLASLVPLVIRGGGSGKSGGAVIFGEGVVIDTLRLNRILEINQENMSATVEPGLILSDLQKKVATYGLFYPPDPASKDLCTIGGNVAENAAGPSTLKYGTTREYVLGGQAIIGTGELIDFGKNCLKGVAGYDIAGLLTGSEGTLGVFTKFILRLLPSPKEVATALILFAKEKDALKAINLILASNLPRALEFMDEISLAALKKTNKSLGFINEAHKAALLVECDAYHEGGAFKQLQEISLSLASLSVLDFLTALDENKRRTFWQLRSSLSKACRDFLGYKISEDLAVPLGKISHFKSLLNDLARPYDLMCAAFGHAGDGNLHVQIMFDEEQKRTQAEKLRHEILLLTLKLGGTLSAEHGIGLQKKDYLALEQSKELIDLQKRLKHAFDPKNLINPYKIFV